MTKAKVKTQKKKISIRKVGTIQSLSGCATFYQTDAQKGVLSEWFLRLNTFTWIRIERLENANFYCPRLPDRAGIEFSMSDFLKLKARVEVVCNPIFLREI